MLEEEMMLQVKWLIIFYFVQSQIQLKEPVNIIQILIIDI